MPYQKLNIDLLGQVVDVRHVVPTSENIAFAKSKGWPEPREKYVIDHLVRIGGVNVVLNVESLLPPTLESGKMATLNVELSAPKFYFNYLGVKKGGA